MTEVLRGLEKFAVPYIDDVAVYSEDWDEHLKHLEAVMNRIKVANLTIKPGKCRLAQHFVKYLGHTVGQGKLSPAGTKIQAVRKYPTPKSKTEIRSFLGLAGYYRRYVPDFSRIAAPLTDAIKGKSKKGKIEWTEECNQAFNKLKEILVKEPVLSAPDFSKEFVLQTDASDLGIGVILSQADSHGHEHPILYLSKKFNETERKFSTIEKECAAIVWGVKKLHVYLDGPRPFKVVSDHNPLRWLDRTSGSNLRLLRWSLMLQQYDFEIVHRPGSAHKNADALSRAIGDII
jgi:hypothetical protein